MSVQDTLDYETLGFITNFEIFSMVALRGQNALQLMEKPANIRFLRNCAKHNVHDVQLKTTEIEKIQKKNMNICGNSQQHYMNHVTKTQITLHLFPPSHHQGIIHCF